METKFTKGKWKIVKIPEYHEPRCSNIEIHSNKHSGWICKIQNNGVIGNSEGLANAKLIEAAPDMLEALEECIKAMKLTCSYAITPFIERAEKAIKKATE